MKLGFLTLAVFLLSVSCSSPKEKYDDQRMEAKEEYDDSVKQAEEEYRGDETDLKKERAKRMVDDSDDVDVDIDDNKIDLED